MSTWSTITSLGADHANTPARRLGVQLANILAIILLVLSLILFVLYYQWYGGGVITYSIPASCIFPITTLLLNRLGFINLSRVWIGIYIPVVVICISLYSKNLYYNLQQDLDYFTFRFIMLAACVFPPILFSLRERVPLLITYAVGFLLLMGFDFLHTSFGVPFPYKQIPAATYEFTNIVVFITYCILVGAVTFLKSLQERNERKNQQLIRQLNLANEELHDKNEEIEEQSTELMMQSEALNFNQQRLQEAYSQIEQQKRQLHHENIQLESELVIRNQELLQTNSELIKHINELRQFSYTISHNLRGPVASLLGLTSLLNDRPLDPENREIIDHIRKSTQRFDSIIKDLSKIIDIRQDIFRIRQLISLEQEVNQVLTILDREINELSVTVTGNYTGVSVFSVQPLLQSILYNLISNAIKYRSHDRPCTIDIRFSQTSEHYIITLEDNGLGLNLEQHRENLFKLYRRFHQHTEGKGLGLYLVKLQAESLGGGVEVASEVNRFTRFTVTLRIPENVEEQILLDDDSARIFFDAVLNATGVVWKKNVSSDEYRSIYKRGIEFMRSYNTPNWITDMRQQGDISPDDQAWLLLKVLPDAYQSGLRRVAGIVQHDIHSPRVKEYLHSIEEKLQASRVDLRYFNDLADARTWMLLENTKPV